MHPTITFFSGLNTIGGTHVLIGCGEDAILFDYGARPSAHYDWLNPAVHMELPRGLRQHLLTRKAPPVFPLYDPAYLGDLSYEDVIQNAWDGMQFPRYKRVSAFVSHIHQDHMELLPFLGEQVDLYMHRDSVSVYDGVVASGEWYGTRANIIGLADGEERQLGEGLRIQLRETDHDIAGASALLVTAGGHKILYTGDWRTHGRHRDYVERLFADMAEQHLDMIITETTQLKEETLWQKQLPQKELELPGLYREMLREAQGLCYLNILCRNVERVADFIKVTKECGRTLVLDRATALLWHTAATEGLSHLEGDPVLEETDAIRLFEGEDPSGLPYKTVSLQEIVHHKRDYVFYLIYPKTPIMAELERTGEQGVPSHYFHADGNPLFAGDKILHAWLDDFGVRYHFHGTFGHAIPREITRMMKLAAPKLVATLHGNHPELLDTGEIPKLLPTFGQTFDLDKLFS